MGDAFDAAVQTIVNEHAALQAEYDVYRATYPPTPEPGPEPEPEPEAEILLDADFSGYKPGPFTQAMAKETFGALCGWTPPNDAWWADHGATIKTSDGVSVLSITLDPGAYGGNGGCVFFVPLARAADDVTFRMEFQMAPGFLYDKGGKLPGIGSTINSSNPPTGGAEPTNGYTCRHMWLTGGGQDRPAGTALAYTYHPSQDGTWGDEEFVEETCPIDSYEIWTTRVVMNSASKSDGILQSRFGDEPWTLDRDDYLWRPNDTWHTNRLCFAVFRGGNDPAWACDKTGVVQFKRITVTAPAAKAAA